MRKQVFSAATACGLAVAAVGCAGGARYAGPDWRQDADSIFRALDLPTPTLARLGSGAPGPAHWAQRADYRIDATLDAENRTITATAHVTYTNNAPEPLTYLWLNLEQNLFNDDSIGGRLTRGVERFGNRDGFQGGYDIDSITHNGEPLELTVYDTLGRVELPEPIAPAGGVFEFDIAWSFPVPPYGSDRLAIEEVEQGTVFEIAQWFPAVAKYDDVHGWNTLPYIGQGEFYTDFGDYDVSITAPRDHIVVATGELANPSEVLTEEQMTRLAQARTGPETVVIRGADEVGDPASRPAGDGPLTWRFHAENVRTFAWASSDAFIWDAAQASTGTLIQSVYPKEGLPLWEHSTEYLRFSVEHYSEKWFGYPWPVATNVNGRVGGMEYPMIIFCRNRTSEQGLFGVTTHEIGHNWFPMTVSTDERRHAWMDEGFNTFINYYAFKEYFPDEPPRRGDPARFARFMTVDGQQPVETPADYLDRRLLGALEYAKTSAGLVLLREQILGPERFDRAFREYIRRWAFKSPRPADFFRSMEDSAGADLAWFWRGWFLETGALDQAVTRVKQAGDGDASITFRNLGRLVMPVVYDVVFEDGSAERRRLPVQAWATTDEWTVTLTPGRRVREVVIDPDEAFPDIDRSNNRARRHG
ncbi:MAG: M1 family peptidase [Planctomycetota bacterium]|nr:MAG: M1 family peptidase [Planctomycetota bacterium]